MIRSLRSNRTAVKRRGFTLLEFLVTILIVSILSFALVVFIPSFINWAKNTSDKQTLTILNDALSRYKTEGGNLAALTSGAPIGNVLSKMKSPIIWGNLSHNVMQSAQTYPAASISASGSGTGYYFTRYNTYTQPGTAQSGPTANVVAIAYDSSSGAYSTDGVTWHAMTLPTTGWWWVASGGGEFVAVGDRGIASSSDGINWTMTAPGNYDAVCYGNGMFVADGGTLAYSSNGTQWTFSAETGAITNVYGDIGGFVSFSSYWIFNSTNGTDWNNCNINGSYYGPTYAAAYDATDSGGPFYVAITGNGDLWYSADGFDWFEENNLGQNIAGMCFGNGGFVIVGNGLCVYTPDFQNWVTGNIQSDNWNSVTYSPSLNRFIAVAQGDTNAAYSSDGQHWNSSTLPASSGWVGVAAR